MKRIEELDDMRDGFYDAHEAMTTAYLKLGVVAVLANKADLLEVADSSAEAAAHLANAVGALAQARLRLLALDELVDWDD